MAPQARAADPQHTEANPGNGESAMMVTATRLTMPATATLRQPGRSGPHGACAGLPATRI
jgi:hypothetical protein